MGLNRSRIVKRCQKGCRKKCKQSEQGHPQACSCICPRQICSRYDPRADKDKEHTFSRHSWPMALVSTRTSKITEFGWLIKHHILTTSSVSAVSTEYQELLLSVEPMLVENAAADHLLNSKYCPIMFTANRLLYKLFAHFTATSMLRSSCRKIESGPSLCLLLAADTRAGGTATPVAVTESNKETATPVTGD